MGEIPEEEKKSKKSREETDPCWKQQLRNSGGKGAGEEKGEVVELKEIGK